MHWPIRPAGAADRAAVEAMVAAAYAPWVARLGQRPGPLRDDYASRIAQGAVHVAERDGAITGVLVTLPRPGALLLDNVAVAPAAQGRGLGRALIAFAEGLARARGAARVTLYTHERMAENLTLYPRLGYVETGRGVQDGYPRVFFEKRLAD